MSKLSSSRAENNGRDAYQMQALASTLLSGCSAVRGIEGFILPFGMVTSRAQLEDLGVVTCESTLM